MSETQEFSQFTIEHQLNRQIRVIAPSLFCDKERSHILQILLSKREAIKEVKIVPEKNSVTIYFSPELLPLQDLLKLLESVLVNFSQKPKKSIKKTATKSDRKKGEIQEVVFRVGGMSCASCALFLEMVLSREEDNIHVSINYASGIGTVCGYLGRERVFKIVEENGYQAYSIDTLEDDKSF
jgi:Cu+-exporting ATPase